MCENKKTPKAQSLLVLALPVSVDGKTAVDCFDAKTHGSQWR
jgi:hypothetical protein